MVQCRLIQEIKKRYEVSFSWHTSDGEFHIKEYDITKEQKDTCSFEELEREFGTLLHKCDRCGIEHDGKLELQISKGERRIWNTKDGKNDHPGDMFFTPWIHGGSCIYWDNCKDPRGHLMVVLPNGHVFDTDARSANCNKPKDKTHRCWQKKGEPPLITIGGPTSDNGVGSIGMADFHGYLTNGILHT